MVYVPAMEQRGYETLLVETFGPVLRVTLNRPERRNALTEQMAAELLEVTALAERDSGASVVILRGSGAGFCSGWDVSPPDGDTGERAPSSPLETLQMATEETEIFDRLWRCAIPTIAQIHGPCLAAGTDLALSCDLVICAEDAVIGYPPVRSMGLPATQMWLYHLGPQWTKRLLLTGDSLLGSRAVEVGLALAAIPSKALDDHVLALARRIAMVRRDLLIGNKHVINRGMDLMGRALLQETAAVQGVLARLAPGADVFMKTAAAQGIKQAIAERDGPFAAEDPLG